MAAMSNAQATILAGEIMELFSGRHQHLGADLKVEFVNSVVNIDAWFDAEEANINSEFTVPIRSNATLAQKVEFFERIVQRRRDLGLIG